jgi:hypothetical protein
MRACRLELCCSDVGSGSLNCIALPVYAAMAHLQAGQILGSALQGLITLPHLRCCWKVCLSTGTIPQGALLGWRLAPVSKQRSQAKGQAQ